MREPAIEVRNLTVSYREQPAIRNVSFQIEPGLLVGLVGPNGAGKSTLLKALVGLVVPDTGSVRIFGQPVPQVRRLVAYVPQRSEVDWDYPIVVEEVVLMGRFVHLGLVRRAGPEDRRVAREALRQVGMERFAARQIGQLSGGQQQRVFLARALAQEAQVLLLDEPFVGVDAATEETIYALLRRLQQEGRTVVVATHDLSRAQTAFDRLLLLNQVLVAYGPPERVFTPALLQRTYGGRLTLLEVADRRGGIQP
ncbi:MAG: metal ABC transporter ATP-binding protein [Armatimonadota bacterium]|nr:metal ABC transporter ATP-binding protein [Armatimonadota bacterium]MDR7438653.1 metal ABC transporter ATP-binding protein [Armatimonadota bacterium]MDR7568641.1 metal ABC transporter ATP-binding protein [Armatimonadota bacterium]MDR7601830.1 metal ABC transporter ATP-binding protein [Armatimonadota bacterium]